MQRSVDTFLNIIKRREEVLYRTSLPTYAANIAYVSSEEVSSLESFNIADRSGSIALNKVRETDPTSISGSKTFYVDTPHFVVTDVFTEDTGRTPIPLFYKHVLDTDKVSRTATDDFTLATGVKLLNIEILDTSFQPVAQPALHIDYDEGIIYSNFLADYRSASDYDLYYIKYTVRTGASGPVYTYTDLLDQQKVFVEAEFDDLDLWLGIKAGRKVYLIEEVTGQYKVTLPTLGDYAYKQTLDISLGILQPVVKSVSDPWYVRVTNGNFLYNPRGQVYRYYISEFLNQAFTPEPTFKFSELEESTIVGASLVKTDNINIRLDEDLEMILTMQVSDVEGNAIAAFTTDSRTALDSPPGNNGSIAPNGKTYTKWSEINRTGIKSIDRLAGVVEIEGFLLKETDQIECSYYYDESNYEFTLINFNPASNRSIVDYRVSLFIKPEPVTSSVSQTLYYLMIDKAGKVVDSNWDSFNNTTQTLTNGSTLYYEDVPSWLLSPPTYERFIENYTLEASGIAASGVYMVLGDITVDNPNDIDELVHIDSRYRGGGILEDLYSEISIIQPEAQWYSDIGYWDGIPYPGNASYLVELPVSALSGAGGDFTASQVTSIIEKHTALGVYPVARAYGVEPTVSGIVPSTNSITLTWMYRGYPLDPDDPSAE